MKALTKQRIQKPFLSMFPIFAVIAANFVLLAAVDLISMLIYGEKSETTELVSLITGELSFLAGAVYACIIVKEKHSTRLHEVVSFRNFDFLMVIMVTVFAWTLRELCDHLVGLIFSDFMTIEPNEPTEMTVMNVIGAVILAPILEEIIFRYGACEIPRGAYPVPIICIANGIFFSIVHGYNFQGFINIFIGGVITAYIFIKTRNILYTMLEHFFHNALCCIPFSQIIGEYRTYKNGFLLYSPWWLAINAVLFAISIVYFVKVFCKKYTEKYYEIDYETGLAKTGGVTENE